MLFMTHIVETLQRWTSPSAPQPVFHSPHALKAALARERARSDRSGTVFSFLTFTREAGVPKATLENVLHVLRGRLRTTDEFGWLDDRQVGVVLLDAPATQTWLIADGVFAEWPESLATPRCEVFSYPSHEPVHLPVTCPDRSARPARPDGSSSVAAISGVSRPIQRLEPFFVRRMALLKRIVDASGALLGMLVTAPFIALAALAVRLTSPGPAIYRQERAGVGGEPFIIYKLRTMRVDADTRQHELADLNEQDGPASKIEKDPRVTPVGRFLQKTSLDELPQLWNVLRGDMSLVGPPPLPMAEAQTCEAWQQRRLDVTPGLTGVWQVEGRARTGFTDWVRMDMRYIRAGCSSATSSYSHSPCLPSCFERAHTSRLAPPFVVPTAGRPSRNGRRLHRQRAGADNSEGGFPVMTVTKRLAGSTSTALNRMLGSRSAGALGILVYHRIAPRIRSYPPPTMNCQPESLQAQLRGLVARGYEVWPLARVLACHESGDTIPPRTLVITFDD